MHHTSPGYRLALRLGHRLLPAVAGLSPKLGRGHAGRLAACATMERWATGERGLGRGRGRDRSRPLIWFHASSVGEGLQAEAVLRALREDLPDCQYAYTWFSPSAERLAAGLPVDVSSYIPYDLTDRVDRALAALDPTVIVFSKLDLWPELACRARARGAGVVLIAGTVRRGSGRLRWPVRRLLRPGYQALTAAGAVSAEDGARLVRLGVAGDRIRVTGDPRYDSVVQRVERAAAEGPVPGLGSEGGPPALVAGSTWPADEGVVLEAFSAVRRSHPAARLIVAPHEPHDRHLKALDARAASLGLPHPVPLDSASATTELVVVDRVGVLAAVYGAGRMAYVGGAMNSIGIHSVLEPAAWGVPVAFGPRWDYSRDAGELLANDAARALGEGDPAADLAAAWRGWLEDETTRRAQGSRARRVVESGRGGAARNASLIREALLHDGPFDGHRAGRQ